MNLIEKEQLRVEIQHIFDSGANEIRIFEMVKRFIESRPIITNSDRLTMRDEFAKSAINSLMTLTPLVNGYPVSSKLAKRAYQISDAMLKEREL